MSINDGGPAFPVPAEDRGPGNIKIAQEPGMSLRDYFAAKAMQGFLTRWVHRGDQDELARLAYFYADAMLAARANGTL